MAYSPVIHLIHGEDVGANPLRRKPLCNGRLGLGALLLQIDPARSYRRGDRAFGDRICLRCIAHLYAANRGARRIE